MAPLHTQFSASPHPKLPKCVLGDDHTACSCQGAVLPLLFFQLGSCARNAGRHQCLPEEALLGSCEAELAGLSGDGVSSAHKGSGSLVLEHGLMGLVLPGRFGNWGKTGKTVTVSSFHMFQPVAKERLCDSTAFLPSAFLPWVL